MRKVVFFNPNSLPIDELRSALSMVVDIVEHYRDREELLHAVHFWSPHLIFICDGPNRDMAVLDLLSEIRDVSAPLATILAFVTADTDPARRALALERGASHIVEYPINVLYFLGMMSAILRQIRETEQLQLQTDQDWLTNLLAPPGFARQVTQSWDQFVDHPGVLVVGNVRIRNISQMNHDYGKQFADRSIKDLAQSIRNVMPPLALVMRRFCGHFYFLAREESRDAAKMRFLNHSQLNQPPYLDAVWTILITSVSEVTINSRDSFLTNAFESLNSFSHEDGQLVSIIDG